MRRGQPSRPFSITTVARLDIVAFYFRGLPPSRKHKSPRVGSGPKLACQFECLVAFRTGGIWRASSKAPAARLSQASLSDEYRVSLFIALQISGCFDL